MDEQELMYKFSMFQQHAEQLQQQIQAVEQGIHEVRALHLDLDDLKGKKDKEIFAPVGRGIYAKARLLSEELTVDIGEKNFVKKSIDETKEIIEEQIKKLKDVQKELQDNLQKIGEEMQKMIMQAQEAQMKGEGEKAKH